MRRIQVGGSLKVVEVASDPRCRVIVGDGVLLTLVLLKAAYSSPRPSLAVSGTSCQQFVLELAVAVHTLPFVASSLLIPSCSWHRAKERT